MGQGTFASVLAASRRDATFTQPSQAPPCSTRRPRRHDAVPEQIRDQLQTTLGAAYTLQRELGGGGMSRLFLARDAALERDVVVKVLSPDLAAGVSAERFTREIKLAAELQQANIVPLLARIRANAGSRCGATRPVLGARA